MGEPKEKKPREKKEKEPKEPKKRGRKPQIQYNEAGEPIEPAEKKPKRQYNRKKKPVPGALGEDDMEKVEVPMDGMLRIHQILRHQMILNPRKPRHLSPC